ncbi:DUF1045 domain-containing protein [Phyllobacterium sophorae]|uniref:Phosphonate metabolism protein n=1 Tax=Phyllobacterium sophorae TaxID=1520277 RepID=A0A2P7B6Q8_9HYPH|nr:DUF1045 domain-containing protein [Phyllobacterium sophorae]PSH62154.1 hypothetical protein CU103_20160 [Phyllobacterium sophorae]
MSEQCGPRYAIYYTPAREHPLTVAASSWLGRNAFSADPVGDARPEAEVRLTAEPRRYGFHATLKAPFRMREGALVEDLEQALGRFAASRSPCPIGPLRIDLLGGFFALVPASPIPTLRGFATHIVEEFDQFRAPMNAPELQRRLQSPLDETETAHLVQWGYPYVLNRFRFHMTLTDRVPEDRRAATRARLEEMFEPHLSEDYRIDTLSLFVQEHRDADFVVRSQFALKTRTPLKSAV